MPIQPGACRSISRKPRVQKTTRRHLAGSARHIRRCSHIPGNEIAVSQLATKTGAHGNDIEKVIIWGNHSSTQYPDISHTTVKGKPAKSLVDQAWIEKDFIPTVQQRGAAIIKARGLSSAASAANAAIDHMRDWALGAGDRWVTMGIPSDGSYGIPEDVIYGFPVLCRNGEYTMVRDLEIDEFSRTKMDATLEELNQEREGVKHLLP